MSKEKMGLYLKGKGWEELIVMSGKSMGWFDVDNVRSDNPAGINTAFNIQKKLDIKEKRKRLMLDKDLRDIEKEYDL
ncbi:hypothetical protein NVP1084O_091 [Vibrio phage 1.084.O._10N.261.49.F5]|nr:hypothetical protein NVP1084O_091 [Vibrio phage 1.084.O._10N.261.49.F5]